MSEIVTIKIERNGTRLATTLINSGDDMHPLAVIQALVELSGIVLKRHMEDAPDEKGSLADIQALMEHAEGHLKEHMEEVLYENVFEKSKSKPDGTAQS